MKIHLFGASGSGVTTLGQALTKTLAIPYFDSDAYYWAPSEPPFTVRRAPEDRNARLLGDLAKVPNWILGGSIINWDLSLTNTFDLAVFLWVPPATRLARLEYREWERYGDIIYTDPARYPQFVEFIDWAAGYDDNTARGRTLVAHEAWMKTLTCPLLEIRGDYSMEERLQRVMKALNVQ